jgi:hypothetical protein
MKSALRLADEALSHAIAVRLRGSTWGLCVDCLLLAPSATFSWPASIFAGANSLAVFLVEPSTTWLLCGVAPSLTFSVAAFESERGHSPLTIHIVY